MTTRQVAIRVKSEGKAEVVRDLKDVGQAGAGAYERIAAGADRSNAATDRQIEKWRKLAAAAREAQEIEGRQARFNAFSGIGGSGKSARDSAAVFEEQLARKGGLSRFQQQTLVYTASDVVASLASGANPGVIALQQGGQVAQAFTTEIAAARLGLLAFAGGVGVFVAALGLGTAAVLAHQDAINKLEVAAEGLGRTSGVTAGALNELAQESAEAAELSVRSARELAATYVATGRIGEQVIGKLIGLTRNYAATTGQDLKTASAELAKAFADPAKGADVLNSKLSFLDDATRRYILTLASQNRQAEAQLALANALGPALLRASDHVNTLAASWEGVRKKASDAFSAMGAAIDRALGGGTDSERLGDLEEQRRQRQRNARRDLSPAEKQKITADLDTEIAQIKARLFAEARRTLAFNDNLKVQNAQGALDAYNPLAARRRDLELQRAQVKSAIDAGAYSPAGLKEARTTLQGLDRDLAAVKAGYSSASVQAAALAKAGREGAKDAREAAREAEEAARNAATLDDINLRNQLTLAKLAGQDGLVEGLEREQHIRQLTNEQVAAGVDLAKARAVAEHQVGQELLAQFEALKTNLPKLADLVRTPADLSRITSGFNDSKEAVESFRVAEIRAFDILADKLAYGSRAFGSWKDAAKDAIGEVIAELIRLSVINPIKNAIFSSQSSPTLGSNFFSTLFGSGGVPAYATGTAFAAGGMALVGERGPELVKLPRGAQVFDAARTRSMTGGMTINVNVNAEAGVSRAEVVEAVERGVRVAVREANQSVPGIVNDGIQRRIIR